MAYPGQDLKYRITATKQDFSLAEDLFMIVIKNSWGRVIRKVMKGDCFFDSEGRWYFALENMATGVYTAYFLGGYEDDDYDKQRRVFTDVQTLCIVDERGGRCRKGDGRRHRIKYEQVWVVSVDGEDYLADCYGRYIYTSDGKRIRFTNQTSETVENMGKVYMKMTGEKFLQLIEGKDPNGEVNTLPELMDAMRGIDDSETIPQKIQEEIDENQEENEASDADIDSIFEPDVQTGGSGGFPDEMQVEEGD